MNDSRTTKIALLILLTILTAPHATRAQQRDDFVRPFFGYYGSQSLGTAIGNATVAAGQVVPGMSSNPANIGLSRFGHLQVNFQNNSFKGPNTSSSSTAPGGIYSILPVPVYQGSLAFGVGIQKMIDFSNGFQTISKQATESGGIFATEIGVSYEAVKDFYLGGAFRYVKGSNELSTTEGDNLSLLNPEYRGHYFTIGFLNRTSPNLQIGASVDLPSGVRVKDKLTTWSALHPQEASTDTWNYTLTRPMVFHIGFSMLYSVWSGFYEMEWSDWGDLDFASDEYFKADIAIINGEIARDFRSTMSHHLGAAVHLPWLPLHLYAGYQYLPVPFGGVYKDDIRQSISGGASYLMNQQFSLHGSLSNYFWKYRGSGGSLRDESNRMVVFGGTLHF